MNIVYFILAVSVQQSRQNTYLHNLFQENSCFVLDLEWGFAESSEITVFWHNSVSFSR